MIEPRNIMAISLGSNCVQQPLLSATGTHFGSISNELANETLSRDNKGLVRNRLYCCFSFFISFLHFDPRGLIDSYKLSWIAILGLPCPSALSVVNKSSLLLRSIHILICASLLDKEFYKSQQSPPMLEKSLKREREKKKDKISTNLSYLALLMRMVLRHWCEIGRARDLWGDMCEDKGDSARESGKSVQTAT